VKRSINFAFKNILCKKDTLFRVSIEKNYLFLLQLKLQKKNGRFFPEKIVFFKAKDFFIYNKKLNKKKCKNLSVQTNSFSCEPQRGRLEETLVPSKQFF